MDKFGYARVSTKDQNLARQIKALKKAGCEKIYEEKVSGKSINNREQLNELLGLIREDDTVVVISLDRLGRNNADLTKIISKIDAKGAMLQVLDLPSFDGIENPNLKRLMTNLVLEIFKYQAQAEREAIHERQRQGIAVAKEKGTYKGSEKQYATNSKNATKRLVYENVVRDLDSGMSVAATARHVGLYRQQVYRLRDRAVTEGLLKK